MERIPPSRKLKQAIDQMLVSCLVNIFSLLKAFITAEKLAFALDQSLD
jgi:hypothetical protein